MSGYIFISGHWNLRRGVAAKNWVNTLFVDGGCRQGAYWFPFKQELKEIDRLRCTWPGFLSRGPRLENFRNGLFALNPSARSARWTAFNGQRAKQKQLLRSAKTIDFHFKIVFLLGDCLRIDDKHARIVSNTKALILRVVSNLTSNRILLTVRTTHSLIHIATNHKRAITEM